MAYILTEMEQPIRVFMFLMSCINWNSWSPDRSSISIASPTPPVKSTSAS